MKAPFEKCCPWPHYCEIDQTCYLEEMRLDRETETERFRLIRESRWGHIPRPGDGGPDLPPAA